MTDSSAIMGPAARPPGAADERRLRAFTAASRHSVRVRRLRRLMIGGALVAVVGIVGNLVFDPFGRIAQGVSIAGATIDGTKVIMVNPKLAGFQRDGRPYAIEASRAVQDVKKPSVFELHDLTASLAMSNKSTTRVSAPGGIYDSTAETMQLQGEAHVHGDDGLDVVSNDALIEFSANRLTTTKPVRVSMPGRAIRADSMRIFEGGEHVTFEGHVHTDIVPAEPAEAAASPADRP